MTELSTHCKMRVIGNVSRRGLLKGIAATGGLVLAARLTAREARLPGYPTGAAAMPNGVVNDPKRLRLDRQRRHRHHRLPSAPRWAGCARTGVPMIVADELEADWARVRVVQAPGDEKTYGNQDTDGSRSTRHFIQPMRRCGAAARQMLEHGRRQALGRRRWRGRGASNHEIVHKPIGPQARLRRARRRRGDAAGAGAKTRSG